jgi:PAS domain S-box-containing protein
MPQNSAQSADPSELARLAALRRYRILDTPEEPEFDRIARLAARLLRAPIGLVSLVDEQRQWFKSHFGLEIRETLREFSFCAHALSSDEVLVVPDATLDPRFADNPLVTGEPHMRFYAGAPLMTKDRFRLGTLSVIDRVPRSDLGSDDFTTLRHLAALVIDEFELRLATKLTEDYAAKIGRLPQAAAMIAGSASIDQALTVVTDHVKSVLGAVQATAALTDKRHPVTASSRLAHDPGDLLSGASAVGSQDRPARVVHANHDRRPDHARTDRRDGQSHPHKLVAPLIGRTGQRLGQLEAFGSDGNGFSAEDEALLKQIAHMASAQIETLLLLERTAAAEARFRRVVESGMIGIIFWKPNGDITEANDAYLSLVGYTRADLAAGLLRWSELTPPEFAERDLIGMEELRRTGICKPFEKVYIRKDGSRVPILIGAAALTGDIETGGVAFVLDMTERKRAEAALLEGQQIARAIVDTALDAFVQMNADGVVVGWNHQAEAMFGWSQDEAIGRRLDELIVPDRYRQDHRAGLDRFLRTGEAGILGRRFEIEARRRAGDELPVELTVTALPVRTGYVFNGFIRDLTEKRATEAQLRQAQKMEAIGQLTGSIAHDFNNLLAIIIGNLDYVLPRLDAGTKEVLEDALEAALRGSDLTGRLLAFARRQPLQPESTDINALVQDTIKLLSRLVTPNVSIELDLGTAVWPVDVDKGQFVAALTNLVTNARDAMPRGGRITISTRNAGPSDSKPVLDGERVERDFVLIEVSDAGTGIAAENLNHVFEPFFTTKDPGKGTGLGLSMVFGFAKQSRGDVAVRSTPGVGTTFRLSLPRSSERPAEAPKAPESARERGRGTILVVEDDTTLRRTVVRQLIELGYTVLEAQDARMALDVLSGGRRIDLLLTDIVMPGDIDGLGLADQAVTLHPALRVLLTSGFPEARSRVTEKSGLTFRLLKKPYRKESLAQMVDDALSDK